MYEKIEKYQVDFLDDLSVEIKGQWKDDVHDLRTRIFVDIYTFTITDAQVEAAGVPFDICHQGISTINSIIGKTIGPGLNKVVRQDVMGKQGCYHLGELVMNSVKAFLQAASRLPSEKLDNEYYTKRWAEWIDNFQDVCIYFSQPDVSLQDIKIGLATTIEEE